MTMNTRRGRMILGIGAGLFVLVAGGLGGMALDRLLFEPQRAAMLAHMEAVVRANQGTPMAISPSTRADAPR
jgi:hypothetical protein